MKYKLPITPLFLMALCFLLPCLLHAQPGFGDDVDDVPIDGGLSLLGAAGVGYAAKRMAAKKNNSNNDLS